MRSASRRAHELLRLVEGVAGRGRARARAGPAARVRARASALPPDATRAAARSVARIRSTCAAACRRPSRTPRCARRSASARASRSASRCTGPPSRAPHPRRCDPDLVAARIEDTSKAWRSWEAEHDPVPRAARRAHPPQHSGAQGPDLPADRRHRRRSDDLAAGDGRRRAQLGLPLRLDPRREPDARRALHRRLRRRGRGLRLLHDELGRRARQRHRHAADHVRHRRRARPQRARAAAPRRLARLGARASRQRRLDTDPARRLRRAADGARALPRAARRAASRDPALRRVPRGLRRAQLGAGRRGHVGDARRRAPPRLFEGAVLGRARPRRQARACARRVRARRALGSRARRGARGDPGEGLEREPRCVLAVVRLGRARRRCAADADRRLPARDGPAHALDDRGDRAQISPRTGSCCATATTRD